MDYGDKLPPRPVVHLYSAALAHNPAAVDILSGRVDQGRLFSCF